MFTRLIGVLAAVGILALAGCGGGNDSSSGGSGASSGSTSTPSGTSSSSSSSSSSGSGSTIALAADPSGALKFDKKILKAKAGKVTIDFTNQASIPHAVAVEGNGVNNAGQTVTGGKNTLTVTLKKGTYTFFCPVPGHRQAGMVGKLIVG
jgi:plastocyanin